MPKYEVVEVIRKYWEVEAKTKEEAYDFVMDGDPSAKLMDEDGDTESITEIRETTEVR